MNITESIAVLHHCTNWTCQIFFENKSENSSSTPNFTPRSLYGIKQYNRLPIYL